ncbi:MAG: peptidoglycan-binding protein [Bacteroidales bacterium]|nr:peptidoglycan-binding protein [Bacteroidales bacterium]
MLATIRQGSNGNLVKVAQYLTGFAARKEATGNFNANFVSHICAWQRNHDLTADGVIGPKTWAMIARKAPTCSTSRNRKSPATCALQLLIGKLTVDGVFGDLTKQAVAAYQSAKALTVDGIVGTDTWAALIVGEAVIEQTTEKPATTEPTTGGNSPTVNKCVHYLQWDKRWKNIKYSTHTTSQTIGNSGCGPAAMAQIMATYIDPSITPVEMCALSVEHGYRTYNNGTAWGFFEFVFKRYSGFSKFVKTGSVETLKAALAQGALAVCSMNSGDSNFWTKGGHFITAIGYDAAGYIYANDPNKSAAPRKQLASKFAKCLKQAFIFWPKAKTEAAPNDSKAIIDISKWQGDINFDKLKENVALVIVRASCGSDEDRKFEVYAKAMKERSIPFGVYGYSYAGDVAKAKDEAQKIVKYASPYKPLFYAIDAEEAKLNQETITAYAKELRVQGAERVGCYVAHNHYKDYGYDAIRSLFNFTWIPRYGKNDGTISGSKKPDWTCDLWQYTSTGSIPGIQGNVDMNVITGEGKSLGWFLGGD